ncbi:MAG: toxin-antitoxin system HicB family antitoxin [Candidatus Gracilibacteria bacterium]|jgi:predicted HicB family RNase H-like nuclease
MKKCSYSYLVVPIGEDGEEAYEAIIPKFKNLLIMSDSLEELHELVVEMIQEDIARRKKQKQKIPEPDYKGKFNGQILIRTEPAIHEKLYFEAQASNLSLNKYIESKLR